MSISFTSPERRFLTLRGIDNHQKSFFNFQELIVFRFLVRCYVILSELFLVQCVKYSFYARKGQSFLNFGCCSRVYFPLMPPESISGIFVYVITICLSPLFLYFHKRRPVLVEYSLDNLVQTMPKETMKKLTILPPPPQMLALHGQNVSPVYTKI